MVATRKLYELVHHMLIDWSRKFEMLKREIKMWKLSCYNNSFHKIGPIKHELPIKHNHIVSNLPNSFCLATG